MSTNLTSCSDLSGSLGFAEAREFDTQHFVQDEDAEPGTFTVCDDQNRQMQLICHHLSKANDQTLVESELKKLLGFRHALDSLRTP